MADRTSAGIFGAIFGRLATNLNNCEHSQVLKYLNEDVLYFWELSQGYDFAPQQMGLDNKILAYLGLASKEGGEWVYGPK